MTLVRDDAIIAGDARGAHRESTLTGSTAWSREPVQDGITRTRLSSWSNYFDFLEAEIFQAAGSARQRYIWRGQRRSDWPLSSSMDRLFDRLGVLTLPQSELEFVAARHLESFRYAARGRRGANPAALDDNEWWALGQHFGLATPLLDWTRSPFAAAYFAFEELAPDPTEHRVVYGLDLHAVMARNEVLNTGESLEVGRPPVIEFIDPMSDENPRLVSQGGLFTRCPIGTPVDQWVLREFEGSDLPVLLRVEIPDTDCLACLRAVDRMNINHMSLFPDLTGASRSANLRLELESGLHTSEHP